MRTTLVWLLLGIGAWGQTTVSSGGGGGGIGREMHTWPDISGGIPCTDGYQTFMYFNVMECPSGTRPVYASAQEAFALNSPATAPTPKHVKPQHIRICGHEQPGDAYCYEPPMANCDNPLACGEIHLDPGAFDNRQQDYYPEHPHIGVWSSLATSLDTSRAGWVQP
jgi:hypothetical protein